MRRGNPVLALINSRPGVGSDHWFRCHRNGDEGEVTGFGGGEQQR